MSQKPETVFRKRVTKFLKKLPRTFQMSVQQVAIVGSPDKVLCINGLFVAMEIKSSGGEVSPMQAFLLDEVEKSQGISLVVSPENWEAVKGILIELAGDEQPRFNDPKKVWRYLYEQRTKKSPDKVRKCKKQPSIRAGDGEADEPSSGY